MKKLPLLCVAHFAVDFACAFLCLGYTEENIQFYLLIYNFCAFALQMPLGLLVDRFGRQVKTAGVGTLLTVLSMFFLHYPLLGVITAGIGNALFHVGGGVHVLHTGGDKCTPLGEFVAPGALGLFFGGLCATEFVYIRPAAIAALFVLSVLLLFCKAEEPEKENGKMFSAEMPHLSGNAVCAVVLLFLVVFLRSAAGFQFDFSWKTGVPSLLYAQATAAGKTLGGALADRCGMMKTSFVSLLAGGILFVFSDNRPVCGILAVLLFNFTMPVTLFAAAKLLKGLQGFSFGLLTFALFLGLLPSYCGFSSPLSPSVFGVTACAVSAVLLLAGLFFGGMRRQNT